jgi:intracellular multiplication protein IcmD
MSKSKWMHQLAAALTAGMMIGQDTNAFANATTFRDIGDNIITASGALPAMVQTVAYVGGIGFGVAGIFKLKAHVDQPSQVPMKDGLARLGSGGGLLALPYVTTAMMGSINNGNPAAMSEALGGTFAPPATP